MNSIQQILMKDIEDRADIIRILRSFYEQVVHDPQIGFFFTEIVPLDVEVHLPVITDFWESVLFGRTAYRNDVMAIHRKIHQMEHLKKEHLDRWVSVFTETVDSMYEGTNAARMKQRALSIATMMDIKLNHGNPFDL